MLSFVAAKHRSFMAARFWIWFLFLHCYHSQDIHRSNNFALLTNTLRTFQRAGCDEELVTLYCPTNTSISIQLAQYGKTTPSAAVCPQRTSTTNLDYSRGVSPRTSADGLTCIWPSALQYSLLQTVVEACQKKTQCKFHPSASTFGGDPCPGIRKYVEVVYKCRPDEFRSKVACENDVIQLECGIYSRVAVYAASYGRTEYESVQCPQPEGVAEESCLVSYATEAVIQVCHGKRRCTLLADTATFGNPCRPASRMYLKVIYACAPRIIFKEIYDGPLEPDELNTTVSFGDGNDDIDHTVDEHDFYHESVAHPPVTRIEVNRYDDNYTKDSPQVTSTGTPSHRRTKDMNTTVKYSDPSTHKVRSNQSLPSRYFPNPPSTDQTSKDMQGDDISKVTNKTNDDEGPSFYARLTSGMFAIYLYFSQNTDRFILVVVISLAVCIVIVLMLIAGHLYMTRRQNNTERKFHASNAEHTMPNAFADDISDINEDIALATPLPLTTPTTRFQASSPPLQQPDLNRDSCVFTVSAFTGDERRHNLHLGHGVGGGGPAAGMQLTHGPPPPGLGYVIPPPDAYQTMGRRSEDVPRSLSRGNDNHYYYA